MREAIKAILAVEVGRPFYKDYSDEDVAAYLNAEETTQIDAVSITADVVASAINQAEFNTLSVIEALLLATALQSNTFNPNGIGGMIIKSLFPSGGITLTALQALKKKDVSKAESIGLPRVKVGWIQEVRT